MASIEQLISQPAKVLQSNKSAAGAQVQLTQTNGSRTKTYVTMIAISASAAPAAAVEATLVCGGQTLYLEIPASAYAPMLLNFSKAPLQSDFGESVVLTVPGHGGAVIASAAIIGYQASA